MNLKDFYYDLPADLIAQYPAADRQNCRLLCMESHSGDIQHGQFTDILNWLKPNDILIFNDTKVIPARLYGKKSTGGKVEILIERILSTHECLAQVRASKSPRIGDYLQVGNVRLTVIERLREFYKLQLQASTSLLDILQRQGHMPLPPYINRHDEKIDWEHYQTVYARIPGAVAAPTAGLHFSQALLEQIQQKAVELAFVTLHVGAGTFKPVRVEQITQHKMHHEYIEVSAEVVTKVREARARGGRVIAVGTTTVRALETASISGQLQPYAGETNIFIYPGYQFKTVEAMITNFHLPESTLLMLVCAFGGYHTVMQAYQAAICERYRFFSYGDAMLIYRK